MVTLFQQRLGHGQHAPFRHAGAAPWAGIAEDEDGVWRDVPVLVVDPFAEFGIAVEDHGRPLVHEEGLAAGGSDEGSPGFRPQYAEGYFGAYLRDPDGNKVHVVYRGDMLEHQAGLRHSRRSNVS